MRRSFAPLEQIDQSSIIAFPTIIGKAWSPSHEKSGRQLASVRDGDVHVSICAAETSHLQNCAARLLNKIYGCQGYGSGFSVDGGPGSLTLLAIDRHTRHAVGTLTVAMDGSRGLLAEQMYQEETAHLRQSSCGLSEMVKFAIDPCVHSRRVLAGLFHVAFLYAYAIRRSSDLLIEVTPQHSLFYRRMLGFVAIGDVKLNARVNTCGVLLQLKLRHAWEQIRLAHSGDPAARKTFYALFYPPDVEGDICERLLRAECDSFEAPPASRFAGAMAQ